MTSRWCDNAFLTCSWRFLRTIQIQIGKMYCDLETCIFKPKMLDSRPEILVHFFYVATARDQKFKILQSKIVLNRLLNSTLKKMVKKCLTSGRSKSGVMNTTALFGNGLFLAARNKGRGGQPAGLWWLEDR